LDLASYTLLAFGSLFAILSPLGTVPVFIALTEGDAEHARISMARRACTIAFLVMATFTVLGSRILGAFDVSIPALQMAGGLVILRVGLDMMGGNRPRLTAEERAEAIEKDDIAITPLGVPMLCGPGTITTGIVLESQAMGGLQLAALVGSGAVIYAVTFGLLWVAVRYSAVLGQITLRVVARLMGLLLAAVAVQFMLNGIRAALPQLTSLL
jgi:multiple antibiotic resistance protein